jgi:hypothetical protein
MREVEIERLRKLFRLDSETGRLYRLTDSHGGGVRCYAGDEVCRKNDSGYIVASVGRGDIRVHRIVFALTHGRWPEHQVDHINGIRDDNRPCNLREATDSQNKHNKRRHHNTASGLKGAYYSPKRGKWYSRIMADYKNYSLGCFNTAEEAHAAYAEAARRLHGEFARVA